MLFTAAALIEEKPDATRADVREYPKGYHMLLRDLDGEAVDKDVAAWVLRGRK